PTWEDPDLAVTADGSVILGTFDTAVRAARDLCTFERPGGGVEDTEIVDLASDPRAPDVVWAVTSRFGEPDLVQRTTDGGRSWEMVGEPIDALLESIALAPSDPSRVYLGAVIPATEEA